MRKRMSLVAGVLGAIVLTRPPHDSPEGARGPHGGATPPLSRGAVERLPADGSAWSGLARRSEEVVTPMKEIKA